MDAKLARGGVPAVVALVACTAGRGRDAVTFSPPFTRAVPASSARRCTLKPSSPPGVASAGGALALSPAEDLAAAVDTDNDRVVLVGLARGVVTSTRAIAVGRRPMQAALGSDGRLFVTERGDRAASVYDVATGRKLCTAPAGVDPVGIALTPDQLTLVVTSGLDHRATAIDAETFATKYVVSVPREPRGVAVTSDGTRAVLAHVAGEPLSVVDLTPGATRRAIPVPHPPIVGDGFEEDLRAPFEPRFAGLELAPLTEADRQFALDEGLSIDSLQRRPVVRPFASQAWSVAIDRDGDRVVVPFMVSRTGNNTLFDEGEETAIADEYGGGTQGGDERVSFSLGVFDARALRWERVTRPRESAGMRPVRVPSGVAVGPEGALYVTSMGTNALARLGGSQSSTQVETTPTVGAPCAVAALRNGVVMVFSPFEHSLQIDRRHRARCAPPGEPPPASTNEAHAAAAEEPEVEYVSLGEDRVDPEIALGRRLFHSADDPRIASGGFSCAGCHPDGRDDGLVWFLPGGARQTPTLAGRLERPFNWNGTHDKLVANVAQTVERLGGTGLPTREVMALAAYISRGLPAPERVERALSPMERRGRDLFEGAAACDGCHVPERNFTDGASHRFPGAPFPETLGSFDTPSLAFLDATPPYFHDGRYATLRELLTSRRHRMGSAAALSPGDLDALEAYLRTL